MQRLSLPPGYQVSQGGETEDPREVFGRILLALAVAVMLMYRMVIQSARSPLRSRSWLHAIGGVITSTVLTRLVIPTFYDMLASGRERLLHRLRRKRNPAPPPPAFPPTTTAPPPRPAE